MTPPAKPYHAPLALLLLALAVLNRPKWPEEKGLRGIDYIEPGEK